MRIFHRGDTDIVQIALAGAVSLGVGLLAPTAFAERRPVGERAANAAAAADDGAVQLAQNEYRRRFVPLEDAPPGANRWVETPDDPQGPEPFLSEPEAPPAPAPAPRRIPISPAARAASGTGRSGAPLCDIPTCSARYRSFNADDCTYQPYYGPREICRRGDPNSPAAVAAWRRLGGAEAATRSANQDQAARVAAARAALARSGAESEAARAAANAPPLKASASVSADGDALLDWFDLVVIAGFVGFCIHAFVQLWSTPWRGGA